ncbi:hypothetical protein GLOIN_2v1685900 [Rhizophagus irregularis DAOM 181602=DAOM 197198]|uniref:Uncharacterized protein n=1 Tax=Rhizophagus irregularis (strain DAOM 181602 / DAOM 197198 / MUCL 43194) TaxID=747089 RepID=A0A2P4PDM1_RHIID|nr:hypothetical protein GLOIN_2v1685900 [Rhizophagus irregularis DAOM 181602=DAOM 197198]POG63496.1 hypothetical protein GLOIN_2v1685900 [Rhizophagus irregularis DAOM 181602=DAOM 197198]|eukprot:XP_025170362.1 hypothetical protein GLOIN_2v1685900 [Rhizophagus irregularis DAOM 181602=DAOM 197198]
MVSSFFCDFFISLCKQQDPFLLLFSCFYWIKVFSLALLWIQVYFAIFVSSQAGIIGFTCFHGVFCEAYKVR